MKTEMIPGAILQGAIMGALRMKNLQAKAVAEEHGIRYSHFRNAMFGVSMGETSRLMRERVIDIAGREMVEYLYNQRMLEEAAKLQKEAS